MTETIVAVDLPTKFQTIRPHQAQAVEQIMELFDAGADVVIVDAPTGSGKSLIGELVRREFEKRTDNFRAAYLTHALGLQDQLLADFEYARVIKGRRNYRTQHGPWPEVTADDCDRDDDGCSWCAKPMECPYTVAKLAAVRSGFCIANYAYQLSEGNTPEGMMTGWDLVIADECDAMENELLRFVEFRVSERTLRELQMTPPKKGVRKKALVEWLGGLCEAMEWQAQFLDKSVMKDARKLKFYERLGGDAAWLMGELSKDQEQEDDTGTWVRDYSDAESFGLKPVTVRGFGGRYLWRHGTKFLLMSASVISAEEMMESLGCGLDWGVVSVPSTFPVENRPVHITPIGSMSKKNMDETWEEMVNAVDNVLRKFPDERVLVHTHTYEIARRLNVDLGVPREMGREVFTYTRAGERDAAFASYSNSERSILLAPSMDRGFDFKDDLARVVVIVKVPFPYLGDRQVSARLRLPGGQTWYNVQVVRSIVQMTGRGVRNAEDWAETFILDKDFLNIYNKSRRLFPSWWRDAVNMAYPTMTLRAQHVG
jgi:ATP-dependent DNA helicase DinG